MAQVNNLIVSRNESEIRKQVDIHEVIEILITTLNTRDKYTFEHSWRVAKLATIVAQSMNLDKQVIERIHQAAHLHDIGKVGVPDNILNKVGRLTELEMKQMQEHPVIGHNILKKISVFKPIATIVLHHHERYDGLGYPEGLLGNDIPIESRIIAVADAFDAMTSNRSYRQAQSYDYAYNEINEHVNEQFGPTVVKGFNKAFAFIPELLNNINDDLENSMIDNYSLEKVSHEQLTHSKKI